MTHEPKTAAERFKTAQWEAYIREAQRSVEQAKQALDDAIAERNALISEHYRTITTRRLISLTGLSRDRLYTIANGGKAGTL